MRALVAGAVATALLLAGCGANSDKPATEHSAQTKGFDVSQIAKVDDIAAKLPEKVKSDGKLVVAAAIDYAPAEFRADDLQTAIGYDIDLSKALAQVLGLQYETGAADFASLLPGIGSKYTIGISSFTVTPERTANYNMIAYITVGSSYAVKTGNDVGFDPKDPCGKSIGVQTGTAQESDLAEVSKKCVADGKKAIDVVSYAVQSDVTNNLAGGKIDAMFADSTVADYAQLMTNHAVEVIGGIQDAAPQGIVVAKDDNQLTEAIQEAMQYLMDKGYWKQILEAWGISPDAALSKAELNPKA